MRINKDTDWDFVIGGWLAIIILLFTTSSLFVSCVSLTKNSSRCEKACTEKGFYSSRYAPSSPRNGFDRRCNCLTEAESKVKNIVPTGVRIY